MPGCLERRREAARRHRAGSHPRPTDHTGRRAHGIPRFPRGRADLRVVETRGGGAREDGRGGDPRSALGRFCQSNRHAERRPRRGGQNVMKLRKVLIALLAIGCLYGAMLWKSSRSVVSASSPAAALKRDASDVVLASPGRVDSESEVIEVGAAAAGVISSVKVREGQYIDRGSVLAEMSCLDLDSEVASARSDAEAAAHSRALLLSGSRPEERQVAAENTAAAKAIAHEAGTMLERMRSLAAKDVISRSSLDGAQRDHDAATARLRASERTEQLVNAPPRQEDVARATAQEEAADRRVEGARERAVKCTIKAPISGVVLRAYARPGQAYTPLAGGSLFQLADVAHREIRAEIDERDIGLVRMGQRVEVLSDAWAGQKFSGRVVRIAPIMGRKSVLTGDPAEKSDRDVLEARIALNSKPPVWPIGLRVTVQFLGPR